MQKENNEKIPNVEKQGWSVEKLNEESVNEGSDDLLRKTLRGNEGEGNPEDRDVVGQPDSDETPQGREESKNEIKSSNGGNSK